MRAVFASITAVLAIAGAVLLGATLTRDESSADLDPPGPPSVTDWLALTNLTFTRDAGDGGGTAEICVDVRFTHPGHNLGSDAADWLKFDCWDVVMDEANPVSNGAPLVTPYTLIGTGGKVDQWLSATHRECIPTAAWEFRVRVTEIEGRAASGVISDVGKAIGQGKDPRMVLAGALLQAVAALLDKIFAGEENIGTGQQNFAGGEADPDGEVEKGGNTEYFNYKVKKVVKSEPQQEPNPCQVGTNTPTPTPTPQPTPTPRLPCEDGGNNYPGCCEEETDHCCGDQGFPTCGPSECVPGGDEFPDCCVFGDSECCPSSEPACCDEGGPPPCAVPSGTPTATPTPTPAATPCPNDNDCDGVPNIVEQAYGSDPNDEISTPEHFGYNPLTCIDTLDNDNDGQTDANDIGCLHPPERVGAAGGEHDLPQGPFGFDLNHPFSKSEALAASSWVALISAAQAIDEITPEEGGDRLSAAGLDEQKDALRELVGAVARFAANGEVTEADAMGGFQQPDLDEAFELIAQADDLIAQAVKQDSEPALLEAIDLYRQAFEMFAAGLHADLNDGARGDINCDDEVDTLDPLGMLRLVAGLDEAPGCLYNGDLNCDTLFDAIDALYGLRQVAALGLQLPDGCPAPGTQV